jgi:hypothetical protein
MCPCTLTYVLLLSMDILPPNLCRVAETQVFVWMSSGRGRSLSLAGPGQGQPMDLQTAERPGAEPGPCWTSLTGGDPVQVPGALTSWT